MLNNIESDCLNNILKKEYKLISEKQTKYVEELYNKYKKKLDLNITENDRFGVNLVFIGSSGTYYFPAVIWYVQSYYKTKELFKLMLNKRFTNLSEFQIEFSKIILDNLGSRKGYSAEILECLNFYTVKYLKDYYTFDMKIVDNFSLDDYFPKYFDSFSKQVFKKNFDTVLTTIYPYLIPNNNIWNLGSILIDPDYDFENLENIYPVHPKWLIKREEQPLFTLHQISPDSFSNNFELKGNIVKSINFFISFNSLTNDQGKLYQFSLPDLGKLFELFNDQNFVLKNRKENPEKVLLEPNWFLKVESARQINNILSLLNKEEDSKANDFILNNLDIIISSYNHYRNSQLINIQEIMTHFYRQNIFSSLFYKRFRLDKSNLNSDIIIWIKFDHKKNLSYKTYLKDFFSAIFITGIIIDYDKGLMLFLSVSNYIRKNEMKKISEFLNLFSLEYNIFTKFEDFGFHLYTFPPSNFFTKDRWKFPSTKISINSNDFNNLASLALEKEKKLINDKVFRERIKNFANYLEEFRNN